MITGVKVNENSKRNKQTTKAWENAVDQVSVGFTVASDWLRE